MSEEGEALWEETNEMMGAFQNSFIQAYDLVKEKKKQITAELNLIQEENTKAKYQNEINVQKGIQNPIFFIGRYYNEMDKWLTGLITSYEKMLPSENLAPISAIPKEESIIPVNKGPKSSFDTPVEAYSPKELQSLYKVTAKTFYSWLEPHSEAIGKLRGKRYTTDQVRIIFGIIGEPPEE